MTRIDSSLITPIYVKHSKDMPPPKDPVYYMLASNGLYLCRNHSFFRSVARAQQWPTELARQNVTIEAFFPPIPQEVVERLCGFFGHMSDKYCSEAIALLAWDEHEGEVVTIVPLQASAVGHWGGGKAYPIGVKYRPPQDLPKHWTVFCDIHSHCTVSAFASWTDINDENNVPGLHIVVGRTHLEPPEFHVEAVADGERFLFDWRKVFDDYQCRSEFPADWVDQVVVTDQATYRKFDFEAEEKRRIAKSIQCIATDSPDYN